MVHWCDIARCAGELLSRLGCVTVIIIGIVVVVVACYFTGYGVVTLPCIGMVAIPIVAKVVVMDGPVAAYADECVFSQVVGVYTSVGAPGTV